MRQLITSLFLLATLISSAAAQTAAPAAPESTTQRVLRLTAELESTPLGVDSTEKRRWLLRWLEKTPDYSVVVCEILGPVPLASPPNSAELVAQQMFGNVAFQIRNPRSKDQLSLQLAGVESTLRAYSVLLRKAPDNRIAYLDELLAKQAAGALQAHMAPIIDKACHPN